MQNPEHFRAENEHMYGYMSSCTGTHGEKEAVANMYRYMLNMYRYTPAAANMYRYMLNMYRYM